MTTTPARLVSPVSSVTADTVVTFEGPYDLPRTLGVLQRGSGDPAVRVDPGDFPGGARGTPGAGAWMCQRLGPDDDPGAGQGQVLYRFDQLTASQVRVRVAVSAESLVHTALNRAAMILGAHDDWCELEMLLDALGDRVSLKLASLRRQHPGLRLPATGALFDQLVTVTLEQKVTHEQARYAWRNLLRRYGERPLSASGLAAPEWMRLPLTAEQLRAVASWQWHSLWVQPPLSRTVQRLAHRAGTIHQLGASTPVDTSDVEQLAERLQSVAGIGPWTVAEALQRSHGAADLPAVGDYHLAHFVGEALTGRRTDDDGMLQLLEPFRPHRQRVVRLLVLSGFRMSRYGPRLAPEDHRGR
ncbi:DNA-3-methyladenine glycosylase family protein [Nesterenkonia alba]|uniref:DNA-3-methyladenine glycosylase family protein n=1 Tax=Nesterenkonia alba TaxID=515814 RepID=UPI0003B33AD2|nr:hypothetical protein [Nesterenkonia alba]